MRGNHRFFNTIKQFYVPQESSWPEGASLDAIIVANLELLMVQVGRVMITIFLISMPVSAYRRWLHDDFFTLWTSIITVCICIILLITQSISPKIRIRLISLTIFMTGLAEMLGHGVIESGRLIFFLSSTIAVATMSIGFSTLMYFASVATVFLIGYLYSTEILMPLNVVNHPYLTQLDVIAYTLNFAIILGTVQFMLITLFRFLSSNWEKQLATQRDLQHQKESVERIVSSRTQELEGLLLEKNEIMQVVAHDLRNPIAGLKLSLETLQRYSEDLPPEKQANKIAAAIERLDMMNDTVEEILREDSLENGSADFDPISILPIISKVMRLHGDQAHAKNISLHLTMTHDYLTVHADPMWLEQVLNNLVSNAIKYSFSGGKISIECGVDERCVTVSVKDEGQGLSEEDKEKLFNKFTTLSARPTGNESSVGLGLSIAKGLVEKMEGALTADSPGKGLGTVFLVKLKLGQKSHFI